MDSPVALIPKGRRRITLIALLRTLRDDGGVPSGELDGIAENFSAHRCLPPLKPKQLHATLTFVHRDKLLPATDGSRATP